MIHIYGVWEGAQLLHRFSNLELATIFAKEYRQIVLKSGLEPNKISISHDLLDVISDHEEIDKLLSIVSDAFSKGIKLPDIPPLKPLDKEGIS